MDLKNKIIEMCFNEDLSGWSDLHIQQDANFAYRNRSSDIIQEDYLITEEDINNLVIDNFKKYSSIRELMEDNDGDVDFAIAIESEDGSKKARFRGNLYYFNGKKIGMVFRKINENVVDIEDLNLSPLAREFNKASAGLILVTGPTGSGKSTTLAAMIEELNRTTSGNIITVEDPIEYIFKSKKCRISQREIGEGKDSQSFKKALRAALRQDPDVILVGEIRDAETANICLEASQTGHLVLGTLHTKDAQSTVSRFIQMFSSEDKDKVRSVFSDVLVGVMSQILVPKVGGGKVMASEVMVANNSVRSTIRGNKDAQIFNILSTGTKETGMQTLNMSLLKLVTEGTISVDSSLAYSVNLEDMENLLKKAGYSTSESQQGQSTQKIESSNMVEDKKNREASSSGSSSKSLFGSIGKR